MTHTLKCQLWNMIASVMSRREWEVACASVGRRGATVQQKGRWGHWEGKGAWHITEWYNAMMDSFQNYFGSAIRSNVGNLEEMRKAVLPIYHHFVSTDANPTAQLLPQGWNIVVQVPTSSGKEGSWTFHPQEDHSSRCCKAIRGIFMDLADPKLLECCMMWGQQRIVLRKCTTSSGVFAPKQNFSQRLQLSLCGTCCVSVEQCS